MMSVDFSVFIYDSQHQEYYETNLKKIGENYCDLGSIEINQ